MEVAIWGKMSSLTPSPGDTIHIDLTLLNRGDFAATGVISLPIPAGLTLVETIPDVGYVQSTGEWQPDEVVSFAAMFSSQR